MSPKVKKVVSGAALRERASQRAADPWWLPNHKKLMAFISRSKDVTLYVRAWTSDETLAMIEQLRQLQVKVCAEIARDAMLFRRYGPPDFVVEHLRRRKNDEAKAANRIINKKDIAKRAAERRSYTKTKHRVSLKKNLAVTQNMRAAEGSPGPLPIRKDIVMTQEDRDIALTGPIAAELQQDYGRAFTVRQLRFVDILLLAEKTQTECAREAGYGFPAQAARQLLDGRSYPHVTALYGRRRAELALLHEVTLESQLRRFYELSRGAEKKGQYSAAIAAEKIRAALGGLTTARTENVSKLQDMSVEQLEARLAELDSLHKDITPPAYRDAIDAVWTEDEIDEETGGEILDELEETLPKSVHNR